MLKIHCTLQLLSHNRCLRQCVGTVDRYYVAPRRIYRHGIFFSESKITTRYFRLFPPLLQPVTETVMDVIQTSGGRQPRGGDLLDAQLEPTATYHAPLCLLWATLALARLLERLPSETECQHLADTYGIQQPIAARNAVNAVVKAFASSKHPWACGWRALDSAHADVLITKLTSTVTAWHACEHDCDIPDVELSCLLTDFQVYHSAVCLGAFDSTRADLICSLVNPVTRLISTDFGQYFDRINELLVNCPHGSYVDTSEDEYLIACVANMSRKIEVSIGELSDQAYQGRFDPAGDISKALVDVMKAPLLDYLHRMLDLHTKRVGFRLGRATDFSSTSDNFYWDVVDFFSHASSLFRDFRPPELEPSLEDLYADIDSDLDLEDRHWYWEEYAPSELVDVLTGPENVTPDQVSSLVPTRSDSTCTICFETHITMRGIDVCGHEYGEECLRQQLDTYHASRYKCAYCRASFVPEV